jgi:hypothetical protein
MINPHGERIDDARTQRESRKPRRALPPEDGTPESLESLIEAAMPQSFHLRLTLFRLMTEGNPAYERKLR